MRWGVSGRMIIAHSFYLQEESVQVMFTKLYFTIFVLIK
jgi:hypothetical protein